MGLVVKDSLVLHGEDGRHEIQLCFGDITKLTMEEKVDIVMISAFPNDYSRVPGTLIAALYREHGIDVENVARRKAEDLRSDFQCWLSEPLSAALPYGRLLCFEQDMKSMLNGGYDSPINLVGNLFRAFTTAIGLSGDISVISPLLATGCQGFSPRKMFRSMVTSCAAWMKVGMPLKLLKLVIYVRNFDYENSPENLGIIDDFNQMKSTIGSSSDTEFKLSKNIDAYLVYSTRDFEKVNSFVNTLKEQNEKINLFLKEYQSLNEEQTDIENAQFSKSKLIKKKSTIPVWVEETRKAMLGSKKVVSFLSPSFLSSKDCIDNYNLAMCLSRKHNDNLLAPVYLETMPYVPTYLTLTQWIDCRRKERDPPDINKLLIGASHLLELLLSMSMMDQRVLTATSIKYDVFISYSHRDGERVKNFYDVFINQRPDLRVFFDREELKAGSSWQATLYNALSNSAVIICFLSNTYLTSVICREEFSIALSQHQSDDYTSHTVSVLLDDWSDEKVDPMFSACPCLDTANQEDSISSGNLLRYVSHHLENPKSFADSPPRIEEFEIHVFQNNVPDIEVICALGMNHVRTELELPSLLTLQTICHTDISSKNIYKGPLSISRVLTAKREKFLRESWDIDIAAGQIALRLSTPDDEDCEKSDEPISCVVISHNQDQSTAEVFRRTIKEMNEKNLAERRLVTTLISADSSKNMSKLESADVVVLILSAPFCVASTATYNLMQVAIGCARSGRCRLVPFIVSHLPKQPSYIHLLICMFNCTDPFWQRLANDVRHSDAHVLFPVLKEGSMSDLYNDRAPLRAQLAIMFTVEWIHHICKQSNDKDAEVIRSLYNIREFGFLTPPDKSEFQPKFVNTQDLPDGNKENDVASPVQQLEPEASVALKTHEDTLANSTEDNSLSYRNITMSQLVESQSEKQSDTPKRLVSIKENVVSDNSCDEFRNNSKVSFQSNHENNSGKTRAKVCVIV